MSNRFVGDTPEAAARQMAQRMAPEGYTFTGLYPYRHANGEFAWGVVRCDSPGKDKWLRPMCRNGSATSYTVGGIAAKPSGKPLYRLPELLAAPTDAPVYVVEGEKAAEALAATGAVVTTSGSATSADAADWSPLAGRSVTIWPDHDEPGQLYARTVAAKLEALGVRASFVDVTALGLAKAEDAADWVAKHPDAGPERIAALPRLEARSTEAPSSQPHVFLLRGSQVKPESVDWLWLGWLAAGKFHLIGGAPGTGKTTIAAALGAILSRGGRWPDGSKAKRGSVVIWSGEDGVSDTLSPRFLAAGADMDNVHFVGGRREDGRQVPFDPAEDMELLCEAMSKLDDVRMIILDPVVSAVAGDSHKNNEVRRGLAPIVDMAERFGCAVLGVTHFTKGTAGRDPVERINGSLAFGALARVVLVTAKQDDDEGRPAQRVMLRAKSNIGPDGGGFAYELHQGPLEDWPGVVASRVEWGEAIEGSARTILADTEADAGGERSALEEAKDWLSGELVAGARPAKNIQAEARAAGISSRTLERAKSVLGVKAIKTAGGWAWELPQDRQGRQERQERHPRNSGGLGDLDAMDAPSEGEVAL